MPRKEWVPKNKYCRQSKFTDEEFIGIIYAYFFEIVAEHNRKFYIDSISSASERKLTKGVKISHQAFSHYFKKISQYIWDNYVVDHHPEFQEEGVLDELLDLIYGKIKKITSHRDIYNSLNDFPLHTNADKITGSLIFHLLSKRSKQIRGFKKGTFYLEFSRAFLICSATKGQKIQLKSIYSATELEKFHVIHQSALLLQECLSKKPL